MRTMSMLWLAALCMACTGSKGVDGDGDGVTGATDCDDADSAVFPGAEERCDGIDNDCDALIDDEDELDASIVPSWFTDGDGDGYGGVDVGPFCSPPPSLIARGGDCNDEDGTIVPGADEICDGVDNDCDGLLDSADDDFIGGNEQIFFEDADGDGYGSAASFVSACAAPEGFVADNTDCDDSADGASRNPGAPEICDGVDNNCDVGAGLLVDDADPDVDYSAEPTYYNDLDGDGFGDPLSALQQCDPPFGMITVGGDCDDSTNTVLPGGTEVCDGLDNDCDGVSELDTWALPSHPYRVPVTVRAPNRSGSALPISVEIDFDGALAALGDTSGMAYDSVRVVLQDCTNGYPEVPSEVADGLTGLLGHGDVVAPTGDGVASVVFLYDDDGNLGSQDVLLANRVVRFDVYFGSEATSSGLNAPVYASQLQITELGDRIRMNTGASVVEIDPAFGGLSSSVGLVGRDSVGAQADAVNGNGILFGVPGGFSGWVSAASDPAGVVEVVHEGSMVSVIRGSGNASNEYGGFDHTYTWIGFTGRPELYVKVDLELDRVSDIGPQAPYWSSAVRLYQVDNVTLINAVGGTAAADTQGYVWAHGSYDADTYGLFLGYRQAPAHLGAPVAAAASGGGGGRHLAMAGQDVDATPGSNAVTLPAGTQVADHSIVMVFPHTGDQPSATNAFFALSRGVTTSQATAQAAP